MSTINDLNQGTPTTASQFPFFDPSAGQTRRCSAQALETLFAADSATGGLTTQYSAPNATGFTVTIAPPTNGASVFLLLTPVAGYAAGTITLPALSVCVDGQELLVTCTQSVTTLTVSGNGSTVNGAPSTLAANAFFRLRFDAVLSSWFRVG